MLAVSEDVAVPLAPLIVTLTVHLYVYVPVGRPLTVRLLVYPSVKLIPILLGCHEKTISRPLAGGEIAAVQLMVKTSCGGVFKRVTLVGATATSVGKQKHVYSYLNTYLLQRVHNCLC